MALFGHSSMLKAAGALLVGLGALAGISQAWAQDRQVRLGHNRAWGNTALVIAVHQGNFKRFGLNVSERSFDNPADIVQAIAAGDIDAGVASAGVLFQAVERGVRVKAVAVAQGSQTPTHSYMVRADSGINTVADLKGKTAGIGGFGGNSDLFLRYWVAKAGIDPKSDMKITFVPFQLTIPALVNRQIDIAVVNAIQLPGASKQFPGQLKNLFTYADITREAIGNLNMNSLLIVYGDDFVKRDREAARRFLEAYLDTIRTVQSDPKKAIGDWAEASRIEAVRMLPEPVTLPADGKVYMDELEFEANLALRFGYLKRPVDLRAVVDHSLVEEAGRRR